MDKKCLIGCVVLLALCAVAAAEGVPADSKVVRATVYRGQALVTRTVTLPADKGQLEIHVGNLPGQIVGSTLHADAGDGVVIRSVRYRTRAVAAVPDEKVAEIDKQIKDTNRRIRMNSRMQALIGTKSEYLNNLEQFAAATTKKELSQGVLEPDTMEKMTEQIFTHRTQLAEDQVRLQFEAEDLQEELALLQRKRNELTKGAERTVREAVIFLIKKDAGQEEIRLSYLVNSADWKPAYNIRLGAGGQAVNIEYLAQVNQMSGEDWTDVELTLSTATPHMNAEIPPLIPLWVNLTSSVQPQTPLSRAKEMSAEEYSKIQLVNVMSQREALQQMSSHKRYAAGWKANEIILAGQALELNVDQDVLRSAGRSMRAMEERLAVAYPLEGKMALPSRSDRQLIQINTLKLDGRIHHRAVPLLTNYVYRLAELTNDTSWPLLAGQYSAYIEGQFVGKGQLPMVARGQKFTVGMGVDTQLRCRRELLEKSDRISWGSRIQTFRYRLTLENYKDSPQSVLLLDRIPACKSEDVSITLKKVSADLSQDSVYLRDLRDKGILRWDVKLDASAAGTKAVQVEYLFEIKFPKDKKVGKDILITPSQEKMKAEFEMMMQ